MTHAQPNSHYSAEHQLGDHGKYRLEVLIGILLSLTVGGVTGYFVGSTITSSYDAYAHCHDALFLPFLVSGNVSIGSLGIPRGMTFDDIGNAQSSVVMFVNGFCHYQVFLLDFRFYVV